MAAMLQLFSVCFSLLLLASSRNVISQHNVRNLPGLDGPLPFELQTGYVNIDDSQGIKLFYYFFKSENSPEEDPLLIWFTGGPGCSGLSAILFENGPFKIRVVEYNGSLPKLYLNPYSWTKVSNILFIDAPAGTGFSYSSTVQGSYSSDTISAKQGYTFIRMWLTDHTEFLSNSVYIGGDSYSGKVVPIIVQHISDGVEAGDKPVINLKGYLLGNPITNRHRERNFQISFAHNMGLISDQLFESLEKHCGGEYVNEDSSNVQCNKDLQMYRECTNGLEQSNILEPKCKLDVLELIRDRSSPEQNSSGTLLLPSPDPVWPCGAKTMDRRSLAENMTHIILSTPSFLKCRKVYGYWLAYYWANNDQVQKALNIRKGKVERWRRCNQCGINYSMNVENSAGYHFNLTRKRRYRSLIYHGDHDFGLPFMSTQAWIKSLNASISDDWRPWFMDDQVAGYTRTYANNMTFATIKGAGHLALEYKPKECFYMIKRWLSYEPL